ncbi:MAG: EpsG family protein [Bacteroides sp.]|nr:EpsG family protein [Bacteroides sp.]
MSVYSFFIYTIFFSFSVFFAYISTHIPNRNKPILIAFTYCFIVFFWSIRDDIGFDYANYVLIYKEINAGYSSHVEPLYYSLSRIFSNFEKGYLLTLSAMSALTYFFLFKAFVYKGILWQGILFSLCFQFQFMAANQVRQALAISVFIYLLKYIEQKKYIIAILGIIVVVFFIHTSAFFLLVIIPLSYIRISPKKWSAIIIVLYFLYLKGVFRNLGNILMTTLPLPENYQHFLLSERMEPEVIGFSLIMLFYVLISLYILYNENYIKEKSILTLYMFGVCMYILFIEYHLLLRLSFYLLYINMYIASIIHKNNRNRGEALLLSSVLFYLFICLQPTNMHGVIPFKCIFD